MPLVRIEHCSELHELGRRVDEFRDAFAQNGTVEIETSKLEECDVSMVQLLIAVAQTARNTNRTLELRKPPGQALVDLMDELGLRPDPGEIETGRAVIWKAFFE